MSVNQILSIDLPVPKKGKWTSDALDYLRSGTVNHANNIIDEAYRIGMSQHLVTGTQEPEITASLVEKALYAEKHFLKNEKRPLRSVFFQFCAFTSSTVAGGLFDTKEFTDKNYMLVFLCIFVIAILSHLICFLNDK